MVADMVVRDDRGGSVLIVSYGKASRLAEWMKTPKEVGALVQDVGDAAYIGSQGEDPPSVIAFRKGGRAVRVLVAASGAQAMDKAKLVELAQLLAGRMR